jgi:uncharacterized protein
MRFAWNAQKAGTNLRKHHISFEEACTIFADPSILTMHDEEHSSSEDRWVSLGASFQARILVVVHTWPEPVDNDEELVRLISARRANKREVAQYMKRKL